MLARLGILVALVALLAGCGGDKKDDGATSQASSAPATSSAEAGTSAEAPATSSEASTSAAVDGGDASALLAGVKPVPGGPSTIKARIALTLAGAPEDPTLAFLASGPIEITIDGASGTGGALDASLALKAGPLAVPVGVRSDGTRQWINYAGQWYVLDAATDDGSGLSSVASQVADPAALRKAIGDPSAWVVDPTIVGDEDVEGVPSTHVTAKLDVARFAESLTSLATAAESSGAVPGGQALSGVDFAQFQEAVKDATVDAWVGTDSNELHRIAIVLDLDLAAAAGTGGAGGLQGAQLTIDLTTVPGDEPTIDEPAGARPIDELAAAIQGGLGSALGALPAA